MLCRPCMRSSTRIYAAYKTAGAQESVNKGLVKNLLLLQHFLLSVPLSVSLLYSKNIFSSTIPPSPLCSPFFYAENQKIHVQLTHFLFRFTEACDFLSSTISTFLAKNE
jgi:hypothetical protein